LSGRIFAFPKIEKESEENRKAFGEVQQECQGRGIGILLVGDKVEEAVPPTLSSERPSMQRDIIKQLEMRRSRFDGFRLEDFMRYYHKSEEGVLKHKFSLLGDEVKTRLEKQGLHLVREARGELVVQLLKEVARGRKLLAHHRRNDRSDRCPLNRSLFFSFTVNESFGPKSSTTRADTCPGWSSSRIAGPLDHGRKLYLRAKKVS
jgi:hypothetical protein